MEGIIVFEREGAIACGRHLCVDRDGNVYKKTPSGVKPLSKHKRKGGYEYVEVSINGVKKKIAVHRLVAKAFCENPNNHPQVNHIDGDPSNNKADNLEWVSGCDNQLHSRYVLGNETGFKDKPVVCIDTGEEFISTRDAWRKTGINYSHISECASGKRKTAGGFKWGHADKEALCTTTET
jgi:hypothetical protein